MSDEIKVTVSAHGTKRKFLMLRYVDPITGKRQRKSAGTANRKEAERAAALWEAELREGRYVAPSRLTWSAFRERYELEVMPRLAASTVESRHTVLDMIERVLAPRRIADLTADRLSYFQAEIRKPDPAAIARAEAGIIESQAVVEEIRATGKGELFKAQRQLVARRARLARLKQPKSEATLKGNLAHLRGILSWAVEVGMLRAVPKIQMPTRNIKDGLARGRPVSGEEFDRMLDKVSLVRPTEAARWDRYLHGLWLSGLRLAESLRLTWDADGDFSVDLSGKFPRFRIYAEAEKGHKDRLLPMTPDFAEWLLKTPQGERSGLVFPLGDNPGRQRSIKRVGRVIGAIGKAAGVVVNRDQGKFASAHDLRRSFGTRWASRVKPATLQLLMRHSDIATSMRYYVAQDADDVASELWNGWSHTSGHTSPSRTMSANSGNAASTARSGT